MPSPKKFRGSSFRLSLPYILRFSGYWLLVTTLAVVVIAVISYEYMYDRLTPAGREGLVFSIAWRAVLVLVAMVGLAIFTTHRLAGPMVAIRRALEDVRDGQLDRTLSFRRSDAHLREIENAFEGMMAALRQRIGGSGAQGGR